MPSEFRQSQFESQETFSSIWGCRLPNQESLLDPSVGNIPLSQQIPRLGAYETIELSSLGSQIGNDPARVPGDRCVANLAPVIRSIGTLGTMNPGESNRKLLPSIDGLNLDPGFSRAPASRSTLYTSCDPEQAQEKDEHDRDKPTKETDDAVKDQRERLRQRSNDVKNDLDEVEDQARDWKER